MRRAFHKSNYPDGFWQFVFNAEGDRIIEDLEKTIRQYSSLIPTKEEIIRNSCSNLYKAFEEIITEIYYVANVVNDVVIQFGEGKKSGTVFIETTFFEETFRKMLREKGFNLDCNTILRFFQSNDDLECDANRNKYHAPSVLNGAWCYGFKLGLHWIFIRILLLDKKRMPW